MNLLVTVFLGLFSLGAVAAPSSDGRSKPNLKSPSRLVCKTVAEKRAPGTPLRLYFNYNLPFVYEPEDPTVPAGRQVLLLAGRPVVQLFFERAPGPAGDHGELLQPGQCAFAARGVRVNEPNQVQIYLPSTQPTWISQPLGQRGTGAEKMTVLPGGEWSFVYKFEQVFSVELEDRKAFVTSQLPREQ